MSMKRGYTLVELIVSVAIFSIVMLVVSASFLWLINLDRQARATNDVVANLNFVVDTMERSIRTGTNYYNTWDGSYFSFTDAIGRTIEYQLSGTQIQERIAGGSWTTLTDPRVRITYLRFYALDYSTNGVAAGNKYQPMVVFAMQGTVVANPRVTPVTFVIQSAAAQRLIDL
jgi:prepilin-type N-terminal cleavage/methylation domain-containing protein